MDFETYLPQGYQALSPSTIMRVEHAFQHAERFPNELITRGFDVPLHGADLLSLKV